MSGSTRKRPTPTDTQIAMGCWWVPLETISDIGRHLKWTHPSPDNIDGSTWLLRVFDDDENLLVQSGEEPDFMEAIKSVAVALSALSRPDEIADI